MEYNKKSLFLIHSYPSPKIGHIAPGKFAVFGPSALASLGSRKRPSGVFVEAAVWNGSLELLECKDLQLKE